jgi:hypothetical protein
MVKSKKQTRSKRNSKHGGKVYVGGDIPPPAMHTYKTVSCPLPRVTETCIVRALANATLTAQPTANTAASYAFSISSANVGTGFWDQYRIDAIRFVVQPQNNAIGLVTNSTTALTPLYCVIDYDDVTNLTSAAAAQSYSNCISLAPGESMERTFQPRIAVAAYSGAFTSYANMAPQWIDAASTGVNHYGVKVFIPGVTAAQTLLQSWDVVVEYFISFRKSI